MDNDQRLALRELIGSIDAQNLKSYNTEWASFGPEAELGRRLRALRYGEEIAVVPEVQVDALRKVLERVDAAITAAGRTAWVVFGAQGVYGRHLHALLRSCEERASETFLPVQQVFSPPPHKAVECVVR